MLSFSVCVCVVLFNVELFFLIETYPFLKLNIKNFLAVNVTDFVDVIWLFSIFISATFIYPLCAYHICCFFKNSWYVYQIYLFTEVLFKSYIVYILSLFICYIYILPLVFNFLFQWEVKSLKSTLNIKVELSILSYTLWVTSFKYYFSFIIYVLSLIIIKLKVLISFKKVYYFFKNYKKELLLCSSFFIFLVSPADIYLQFVLLLYIFLVEESIFIIICYLFINFLV
uniref:Sec-independent protein translocase component TatC n=1 Tax=Caulacanthus ustulatus TaxID=31411 RepID=UPI003003445D|nr:Sec-independent protein translocase component TatC [Caulacanthus ustulatus]